MTKIAVTGAHGKAGRAVVADLLAHGHQVLASDLAGPVSVESDLGTETIHADLTDYGQAIEALAGTEVVVHLGNIPSPGRETEPATIMANNAMNSNVFLAAARLGLSKVVWASSETTLGLPFDVDPRYAPVDEAHFPHPTSTYALSKVLAETMAEHISAWSGIPFVGLRLSNIMRPQDYAGLAAARADARLRRWNLWSYIDSRDAATAFRLAASTPTTGSVNLVIAAADNMMGRDSAALLAEEFPGVRHAREIVGEETLLAIGAARKILGFNPRHSWRDQG